MSPEILALCPSSFVCCFFYGVFLLWIYSSVRWLLLSAIRGRLITRAEPALSSQFGCLYEEKYEATYL